MDEDERPDGQTNWLIAVVLVTGGSGFLGLHCVKELLKAGYKVRASVRNAAGAKAQPVRDLAPPDQLDRVELVEADLLKEDTWTK